MRVDDQVKPVGKALKKIENIYTMLNFLMVLKT